ncbi:precorrin-3B C(17)-methyltransferase [Kutzneria albida]|uniref:Precorrin-3 C-17 methylase n=1 Tax=Kutzneria albida DSM 43870 TaxID=1449976 RepID=W5W9F4_9PSEU|nr:precorrin-3B C(17)-methyltransferase [Kutzneria albida]AHH94829.1 precorrin-3 C-17 methylase [Kutzneria albida DSM 43870]
MTGLLTVVGLGPGAAEHRTPAAAQAVREAEVVLGYSAYIDACADLLGAGQTVLRGRMTEESRRAEQAVALAAAGHRVALVSSGDAGVYGMATLALSTAAELPVARRPEVRVLPGVTAALASSALVGAPLAHDFACLTLSSLLTPWEEVERRLRAVAAADLALALYNPRSAGRTWQLDRAREVLLEHRGPGTQVALVTDAARPEQHVRLTTLGELDSSVVGMTTTVLVGASATRRLGDWLVTPRAAGA